MLTTAGIGAGIGAAAGLGVAGWRCMMVVVVVVVVLLHVASFTLLGPSGTKNLPRGHKMPVSDNAFDSPRLQQLCSLRMSLMGNLCDARVSC